MNPTPEQTAEGGATPLPRLRRLTVAQSNFMARLAVQLGLPAADGPALVSPRPVVGPSGLASRLELHPELAAVRLLTLLPLAPAELIGPEVQALLGVQAELSSELGWCLGMSAEGMLQLDAMAWIDDPIKVASELDLMNGVGVAVMRAMLLKDAQIPNGDAAD